MRNIFTLKILLASFCPFLISQNNYTDNFNQPSGTVLCYNCSNVSIENCDTLCSGVNCFTHLILPLSTNNIVSYGCSTELVDFGCSNDTTTDSVTCYCTGNFCNYPEIFNFTETNSSAYYDDEISTSPSVMLSMDYSTIENPYKRSINETYIDFTEFVESLQFLDDLFGSFNNSSVTNEVEPTESLNEDNILQMLNRLDYLFDQKITKMSESLESNISTLINLISANSNAIQAANELKTKKVYEFAYDDYENSGSASKSPFYYNLWKRLLKLYHEEKSYRYLKLKNKEYSYKEKETTIFGMENAVITYSFEINAFVLKILDKNINYKHIIVKRDDVMENFSLVQSIVAFFTSFATSFGEKLGIVTGSVGRKLIDGFKTSVQEQLSQTLTAANIAFNIYTEVLFSKILAIITNFIIKSQSRKRRNLMNDFFNETSLSFQKEYYDFHDIYQRKKRQVNGNFAVPDLQNNITEVPKLVFNSSNKTTDYNIMLDALNKTGYYPLTFNLVDSLNPNSSTTPVSPLQPSNVGSFETSGSFSVITQNNSQFSNVSLTTLANRNNLNMSTTTLSNLIKVNTLLLTTTLKIATNDTTKTTATNSQINSTISTTIGLYTTTHVMTTTASITTLPMYTIQSTSSTTLKPKTTTVNIFTTTAASSGFFDSVYNYIVSFFGSDNSSSTKTTTMASLPIISEDQLPPGVTIGNNGEYTLENGTIILPSQLEVMLQKVGKTLYPTTTESSNWLYSIVSAVTSSVYTFVTAFVNEFNTNFNSANNAAIDKVKDVINFSNSEPMIKNSTVSPVENLTSTTSPYSLLTGLLSAITSLGRKKRDLDNDLNIILNGILPSTITTLSDISNIQKLQKMFREILSNEELMVVFIDHITKNVTLSEKEKSQLSMTIFQVTTNIMKNLTLIKMVDDYSRTDVFAEDYDDSYVEKMGQAMKEMGRNIGKIFNTVLENILLATNDYNGMSERDIEEKMHSDGYQLGLKMGFAIKSILTNFNIVLKRIEKRKKRLADCINDSYCFNDVLSNDS